MSFIPSSAGGITNITSTAGSGIVTATSFGSTELSSGLVAGANVSLTATPAFGGKGLRIDTSPGVAGVTSVTAGTGITLTGTAANPIVNNAGVLGITANPGLLVGGTASNPVLTNDGVLSVTASTGISVGGTAQNPSISNTGVLGISPSSGISIGGTAQNPSVQNTGTLSVNSQTGAVTLASSGGTIAITNPTPGTINLEQSGGGGTLTGITAGTGIGVSGSAPSPTVSNNGVLTVVTGKGVSSSGGQNPIVTYVPDQSVVENPNFVILDPVNNGLVDGRNVPLNAILLQYPGTYYIRASNYTSASDLQPFAIIQTGTAPGGGAVNTLSGGLYTIFNANPVGGNNFTNLSFGWLKDNTLGSGTSSPMGTPQQLSPNQSVTLCVNYLPTQGAGGSAADTTRPVVTMLVKNSVSGIPT